MPDPEKRYKINICIPFTEVYFYDLKKNELPLFENYSHISTVYKQNYSIFFPSKFIILKSALIVHRYPNSGIVLVS